MKLGSEQQERQFQTDLMCGNVQTKQASLFFYDKITREKTEKDTPIAIIEDIPLFLLNLPDQYKAKERLTWNNKNVPSKEIWIKIGGDHEGDSFKFILQVMNLENPNSKDNTSLLCMAECKDSIKIHRES